MKAAFVLAVLGARAAEDRCSMHRLRVALIRHGESMNNVHEGVSEATYRAYRSADPDLSPRGYEQAKLLATYLANPEKSKTLGISAISELWVSPVRRTLLTMHPLAGALSKRPRVECDLFEAGGIYEANAEYTRFTSRGGMTRAEMSALFPSYELPDQVTESGWYTGLGKETDDECRQRAARVAARLKDRAKAITDDYTVLLVVHYDFINALLDALLVPGTTGAFLRWKLYNTGITVFDLDSQQAEPTFIALNAIPHILESNNMSLVSGFHI